MPRLHALELVPDAAGREAVLRDWRALYEAGLPSQLDHQGASNTPHLTVVSAPDVRAAVGPARDLLVPLLPATVRVSGILLLGGRLPTIARAVDVTDALAIAVARVRGFLPRAQHDGWLPHVTLARRVPRERVPEALDALGYADVEITWASLRRWDPDTGAVSTVG